MTRISEAKLLPDADRNYFLPGNNTCAGCGLDLSQNSSSNSRFVLERSDWTLAESRS